MKVAKHGDKLKFVGHVAEHQDFALSLRSIYINRVLKELLIFDLDGTLVNSRDDIALAVNLMLADLHLPVMDVTAVVAAIGEGARLLVERALMKAAPETDFSNEAIEHALGIFKLHYAEHIADSTRLYPGVAETLTDFNHRKKAVLTNKPVGFSERLLQLLGVRSSFEAVVGGDSLPVRKPTAEVAYHVIEQCGATPETSVIIGDSRTDIDCGRNAGIFTCGVTYGFRPRSELEAAGADLIIDDIRELKLFFE